ncbi:MAG: hypothetical protein V3S74_09110 [Alphaproteobacteria bacterium]
MVYVVDDLRQRTYIQAGAGGTEPATAGQHGFVTVECRNAGGLEVEQITMSNTVPAFGNFVHLWTSAVLPTVVGAAVMLTTLRTTGLAGGLGAPESIATRASIITANIPATSFRYVDVQTFGSQSFFINQGQFFNVAFSVVNTAVDLGIRWRELRLFAS